MRSFRKPETATYQGRCLVILRPDGKTGGIILKAESEDWAGLGEDFDPMSLQVGPSLYPVLKPVRIRSSG
jgi:hypothetical protein